MWWVISCDKWLIDWIPYCRPQFAHGCIRIGWRDSTGSIPGVRQLQTSVIKTTRYTGCMLLNMLLITFIRNLNVEGSMLTAPLRSEELVILNESLKSNTLQKTCICLTCWRYKHENKENFFNIIIHLSYNNALKKQRIMAGSSGKP